MNRRGRLIIIIIIIIFCYDKRQRKGFRATE